MKELAAHENALVLGGYRIYSGTLFLEGLGAAVIGGALTVAGLGTPISIAGAAFAAEGGAAMAVGLLDAS